MNNLIDTQGLAALVNKPASSVDWYGADSDGRHITKDLADKNVKEVKSMLSYLYPGVDQSKLDKAAEAAFKKYVAGDPGKGSGSNSYTLMNNPVDIVNGIVTEMGGADDARWNKVVAMRPEYDKMVKSGEQAAYARDPKSTFVKLRDKAEAALAVVGNYYLPGSGMLTSRLVSDGAQKDLGSTLGKVAMIASGAGGAYNGNLANYGKAWDAVSGANNLGTDLYTGGLDAVNGSDLASDLASQSAQGASTAAGSGVPTLADAAGAVDGLMPTAGGDGVTQFTSTASRVPAFNPSSLAAPAAIGLTGALTAPDLSKTMDDVNKIKPDTGVRNTTLSDVANLVKGASALNSGVSDTGVSDTGATGAGATGAGDLGPYSSLGLKAAKGYGDQLEFINSKGFEDYNRDGAIKNAKIASASTVNDIYRTGNSYGIPSGQTTRMLGAQPLANAKAAAGAATTANQDTINTRLKANSTGMEPGLRAAGLGVQAQGMANESGYRNALLAQSANAEKGAATRYGLDALGKFASSNTGSKVLDWVGGKLGLETGGLVSGPGTRTSDNIDAKLSPGEYVLNADAVDAIGVGNLNAINDKALAKREGLSLSMARTKREAAQDVPSLAKGQGLKLKTGGFWTGFIDMDSKIGERDRREQLDKEAREERKQSRQDRLDAAKTEGERWDKKFEYEKGRDKVKDEQWTTTHTEQARHAKAMEGYQSEALAVQREFNAGRLKQGEAELKLREIEARASAAQRDFERNAVSPQTITYMENGKQMQATVGMRRDGSLVDMTTRKPLDPNSAIAKSFSQGREYKPELSDARINAHAAAQVQLGPRPSNKFFQWGPTSDEQDDWDARSRAVSDAYMMPKVSNALSGAPKNSHLLEGGTKPVQQPAAQQTPSLADAQTQPKYVTRKTFVDPYGNHVKEVINIGTGEIINVPNPAGAAADAMSRFAPR